MKTILGIDCSSTTIGYALLGVENDVIQIIEHGNIKPPTKDSCNLIERLNAVVLEIDALCLRLKPDYSIVEDILQFMGNKSTSNTIILLAVFNRAVSLQIYKTTGNVPIFLLPISIRTKIKHFLGRNDKIEKEEIPGILQNYFGKTFFKIVKYKTRGKNKGQPIIETLDEADACAVAWAGLIELDLIHRKS